MTRRTILFALLGAHVAVALAIAASDASRPGLWFNGDFETGGFEGWSWDIARRESAVVVTRPVRKGRHAVRITLAPGDSAASKERAELKVGDQSIERLHGRHGSEMWYAWSLFIPVHYADPPPGKFQILGQWHHRPAASNPTPWQRRRVTGPPPLIVFLVPKNRGNELVLVGRAAPSAPHRVLGAQTIRRGSWIDLLFHIKWSTGSDGYVEAWIGDRPFTAGKLYGATLYSPVANYLRLGLYRDKGVTSTNYVYYDEFRVGASREAVIPDPDPKAQ